MLLCQLQRDKNGPFEMLRELRLRAHFQPSPSAPLPEYTAHVSGLKSRNTAIKDGVAVRKWPASKAVRVGYLGGVETIPSFCLLGFYGLHTPLVATAIALPEETCHGLLAQERSQQSKRPEEAESYTARSLWSPTVTTPKVLLELSYVSRSALRAITPAGVEVVWIWRWRGRRCRKAPGRLCIRQRPFAVVTDR